MDAITQQSLRLLTKSLDLMCDRVERLEARVDNLAALAMDLAGATEPHPGYWNMDTMADEEWDGSTAFLEGFE